MAEEKSNIDYELITKYLAGEASSEEQEVVSLWLSTSDINRHAFAQLKTLWEQTGRIMPHKEAKVDVDKGWKQFKNKVNSESKILNDENQKSKSRSLFFYFSRAAAVLVIGLVIYLIYKSSREQTFTEAQMVAINAVVTDTLPDGSIVSLNDHSQLSFPSKFTNENRPVKLQGEAFFKVVPNAQKPFIVKVAGARITVLGTSFHVKAYDSLNLVAVGVEEGRVKVITAEDSLILETGERVSINRATKEIAPINPYNPNNLYWKTQTLIFQNVDLAQVFQTLERHYNVSIITKNNQILDCRLTAKFYNEDIERIFEIIHTNFNLTIQNEGNRFIISGQGCD